MKSKALYEAFGYVEDKYLDMVDAPEKENLEMKQKHEHPVARKSVTFLIAAAICVSILAVTAMAAGWIPNIFAAVDPAFPEDAEILEAALQVTQTQEVETVSVPEIDFTQFTLYERYYDGESILLGYDLSKVMPEPVIGYQPDDELLAQIKHMPIWQQTARPEQTDDNLENMYALGYLTEEEYKGTLESRTEYAKQYGLDKYWQIIMDSEMKQILSPEQYEKFWDILLETGSCCVALPTEPWVGDHILVNGTDFGEFIGPGLPGNFRTDYTTDVGDCILLAPIPENTRNLDSVNVEISLRSSWRYLYIELDGDVYEHYVQNPPYPATFTLENVNN